MGKKLLFAIVKLAISGGLIWLIFSRLDLGAALESLTRLNPGLLIMCLAATVVWVMLSTWRWAMLVREVLGERLSNLTALNLYFVGLFFHQLVFTIVGGDAMRAWGAYMRGNSLRNAVVGVTLDRLIGLVSLVFLIAIGLPVLLTMTDDWIAIGGVVLAGGGLLLGGAVLLVMDRLVGWLPQVRVVRGLSRIAVDGRRLLRERAILARLMALATTGHLINVFLAIPISHALGVPMTLGISFALIPAVILLSSLPISFAGWGVREGAMVVGFGLVGFDPVPAVALSVLLGLLQLCVSLPGGLIWITALRHERPEMSKLKASVDAATVP